MAAYIVNHILGGRSFSSRLYREVREKRGFDYGVSNRSLFEVKGMAPPRRQEGDDSRPIMARVP
jgi:hypothetical protein